MCIASRLVPALRIPGATKDAPQNAKNIITRQLREKNRWVGVNPEQSFQKRLCFLIRPAKMAGRERQGEQSPSYWARSIYGPAEISFAPAAPNPQSEPFGAHCSAINASG